MAKAVDKKKPIRVGREPLDQYLLNVSYVQSITERKFTSSICHECVIKNYSSLKERTYYTMTREVGDRERTLKLYITKKCHVLQFHCELTNLALCQQSGDAFADDQIVFGIMYDACYPAYAGELTEKDYGYLIEVPNEIVLHADNKYLHECNKLVIQYSYRHYGYSKGPVCRVGKPTTRDEDVISNDFLSLYKSGKFTDFVIMGKGKEYRVHKCICRVRSLAVHENCDCPGVEGLRTNKDPRILELAIRYMYTGKLAVASLSVDELLKIADVAYFLGIPNLLHSLTVVLREKLDKDNAKKILNRALEYEMPQLVLYAEAFLPEGDENEFKRKGRY